jgi:hypothetical protein
MTHTELGAMGEAFVYRKLVGAGLAVEFGDEAGPDLVAEGVPVEVKAARAGRYRTGNYRGYQFCLHRDGRNGVKAAVVVLLCYWDVASEPVAFVVPAERLGKRRKVVITGEPWTYGGMWRRWYRRWETIGELLEVEGHGGGSNG